ncbi:MAG TPA: hypothetical protein VF532_16325 [Candidatus Angelobacter sp.]
MSDLRHDRKLAGEPLFGRQLLQWAATAALVFVTVLPGVSQSKPTPPATRSSQSTAQKTAQAPAKEGSAANKETPWTKQLEKYPGLMEEFARLFGRWQTEVQMPPARRQSRFLPLLAEGTAFYGAFPNYGEAAHQALQIFHQELEQSAVLREWWRKEGGKDGREAEESVEKFYQLSQYLGDEIVVASPMSDKENRALILSEIKKPGLQQALQQFITDLGGKGEAGLRIFTPEQLAGAKEQHKEEPVALVRPDLLAIAFDLSVLRGLNERLNQGGGKFASAPFGRRLAQSYQGGTKVLMGADLQSVLRKIPMGSAKDEAMFRLTGFADLKYVIAENRDEAPGQAANQLELSFTGPRHGAASWLASSGPLHGLDFVSPKANIVLELLLKDPAALFDDVADLVNATQPSGLATLTQMEQTLNISLRDDVLSKLTGEITVDAVADQTQPSGRILLRTNDANGLRQSLERLLAALNVKTRPYTDGGVTYYSLQLPNPGAPVEINYAFTQGYLMIGFSRKDLTEALRLRSSGGSIVNSREFLAALPGGTLADTSALYYYNPGPMMGTVLQQTQPEMADLFKQLNLQGQPLAMRLAGDETTIRAYGGSGATSVATVLIVAAVAIPNLLRSKMAANESAAAATVRTVNTAQVTYLTVYPARGYAPSLATLGPGAKGDCSSGKETEANACLLDSRVGGAGCTAGQWCTKDAFRYSISAVCKKQRCDDYVVVATPVDASHGGKSFCSISDAVVRSKSGAPLSSPITVAECQSWPPIH